ncbi:MAG: hypothetical protein WAS21_27180 [Geminicoccaceae bacterium]
MHDTKRAQLGLRLDPASRERLEALSRKTGTPITTLGRELLQAALKDDANSDLVALVEAITKRLDRMEQTQASALAALHQRLGGIEQLICSADANAASRDALDFARHYDLFKSTRYGIWELQTIIVHVLEYAMLTHGNSREVAYKFHADCQDASSRGFKRFRATVEQDIAAINAGAPAPLQPPPALELTFALPPELPADTAEAGEEGLESDLPAAPVVGATARRPSGNGAAGNTAGEGA